MCFCTHFDKVPHLVLKLLCNRVQVEVETDLKLQNLAMDVLHLLGFQGPPSKIIFPIYVFYLLFISKLLKIVLTFISSNVCMCNVMYAHNFVSSMWYIHA